MGVTATVAMGALIRILTARHGDEVRAVREARTTRRAVGEHLAAYVEQLASETPR